jgi:hypothetical protein
VEEQEGRQSRIVEGAYLLSPLQATGGDEEWKKEEMPNRLFHPRNRGTFRFGVVTLRPSMSLNQIYNAFCSVLEDSGALETKAGSVVQEVE